ncbi:hypothetical protein E4U42_007764 [Claviceps africana]|uniref:Asteroid domain-containing protein n=1 Tax=Claviceps africana TaxID=83212 RepID=A0A8K0JAR1_9HYPO|nr:hypothetical protein E4U42_007764 [Claviceps africana]
MISRSIFFDGYLPDAKLDVRTDRMNRLYTKLEDLYESNLHGCPASYVTQEAAGPDLKLFEDVTAGDRLVNPSFLVPSVIDALKNHEKYQSVTQLVPGEADQFCADDVCEQGGTVLTSDSDLLARNLGHGRVAFFGDLRENDSSKITFKSFVPEKIFETIGLKYPEKALQLAYERQISPRAKFSEIVLRSSRDLSPSAGYLVFQSRYASLTSSSLWKSGKCKLPSLKYSDPRLSEMMLNFHLLRQEESTPLPVRMFLPTLLESPALKSAWDPSTCIRQLAYSLVRYSTITGDDHSVQEFRRIENLPSKGRKIPLLPLSLIKHRMEEIVSCGTKLKSFYNCGDYQFWIALGIAMEMLDSQRQGVAPVALHIYERSRDLHPPSTSTHVSWDDIHIYAQIQGILYSFRILQQVLDSVEEQSLKEAIVGHEDVCSILKQLTPVAHFPNFHDSLEATKDLCQKKVLENITGTLGTTHGEGLQFGGNNSHTENEAVDQNSSVNCTQSSSRSLFRNNMFSSLFID